MGTKRTIDSGRVDKRGHKIKVSENSLAAKGNVESKKNQLGEFFPVNNSDNLLSDKKMMEVDKLFELVNGDGQVVNINDIDHNEKYMCLVRTNGYDAISEYANAQVMCPDWDGEEEYFESSTGIIVDHGKMKIPFDVVQNLDEDTVDNLKIIDKGHDLDDSVVDEERDHRIQEAYPMKQWDHIADTVTEKIMEDIYDDEHVIPYRMDVIHDAVDQGGDGDEAESEFLDKYQELLKEDLYARYDQFLDKIKMDNFEYLDNDSGTYKISDYDAGSSMTEMYVRFMDHGDLAQRAKDSMS